MTRPVPKTRRTAAQTDVASEQPQSAPKDAKAVLDNLLASQQQMMQGFGQVLTALTSLSERLDKVEAKANTPAVSAPGPISMVGGKPRTADELVRPRPDQSVRRSLEEQQRAFIERVKTQPKRRYNFSENWQTKIHGVPIMVYAGLQTVSEEIITAYEAYLVRLDKARGFERKAAALAGKNRSDRGMIDYLDVGNLLGGAAFENDRGSDW